MLRVPQAFYIAASSKVAVFYLEHKSGHESHLLINTSRDQQFVQKVVETGSDSFIDIVETTLQRKHRYLSTWKKTLIFKICSGRWWAFSENVLKEGSRPLFMITCNGQHKKKIRKAHERVIGIACNKTLGAELEPRINVTRSVYSAPLAILLHTITYPTIPSYRY